MNLSDLYVECGRLLNDASNDRWPQTVLLSRINDAQRVIQGFTKAIKQDTTYTVTANTQAVTLNSRTMDVLRVEITRQNGDIFALQGTTKDDLDFSYPNWRNLDSGEPKTWFYDATNQQLNLVPKPDSNSVVTNGLNVTSIYTPTDLASSTDIPFDSNNQLVPYHDAIVHYVVGKCWQDDGTPEALGKAKFHMSGSMSKPGEFELEIQRILGEFDNPLVPANIKFAPQGGRLGGVSYPSKSNPLA